MIAGPESPALLHSAECAIDGFKICLLLHKDAIIHLSFSRDHHKRAKQFLSRDYSISEIPSSPEHSGVCDLFDRYLSGRLKSIPTQTTSPFVDQGTAFQKKVWKAIAAIPYGETKTYGQIAEEIGHKGSARAVGSACGANPLAIIVPCHRVVGVNGLGGYAGGLKIKRKLLELERRYRRG